MQKSLSEQDARFLRLYAQQLLPQQTKQSQIVGVVNSLCVVQAQDIQASTLSIALRSDQQQIAAVTQALEQERTIVRTWGPRNTLHILASEDFHWLLHLLRPYLLAASQKRRLTLGLDEEKCSQAMSLLRKHLSETGPQTRDEIMAYLAQHNILITGQARPYLLNRAALAGLLCFGPLQGSEPTYVLLSDWLPHTQSTSSLSEHAALTELAIRYLQAYGLATPKDMATWSGLPLSTIRQIWQTLSPQLYEVKVATQSFWALKTVFTQYTELASSPPVLNLLPAFDTYLLGYQDRNLIIHPSYVKQINAGGGWLHPLVLANGSVIGTWKSKKLSQDLSIAITEFEPINPPFKNLVPNQITNLKQLLLVQHT